MLGLAELGPRTLFHIIQLNSYLFLFHKLHYEPDYQFTQNFATKILLKCEQVFYYHLIFSDFDSLLHSAQFTEPRLGLILGLHPANERRRYKVSASLIGLVQT